MIELLAMMFLVFISPVFLFLLVPMIVKFWAVFLFLFVVFVLILIYKEYRFRAEFKRQQQEELERMNRWSYIESQRPIIQRILREQEENKPFLTGTITHVDNDGNETKLLNISIKFKDN